MVQEAQVRMPSILGSRGREAHMEVCNVQRRRSGRLSSSGLMLRERLPQGARYWSTA